MMRISIAGLVLFFAFLVAGCGGGGSSDGDKKSGEDTSQTGESLVMLLDEHSMSAVSDQDGRATVDVLSFDRPIVGVLKDENGDPLANWVVDYKQRSGVVETKSWDPTGDLLPLYYFIDLNDIVFDPETGQVLGAMNLASHGYNRAIPYLGQGGLTVQPSIEPITTTAVLIFVGKAAIAGWKTYKVASVGAALVAGGYRLGHFAWDSNLSFSLEEGLVVETTYGNIRDNGIPAAINIAGGYFAAKKLIIKSADALLLVNAVEVADEVLSAVEDKVALGIIDQLLPGITDDETIIRFTVTTVSDTNLANRMRWPIIAVEVVASSVEHWLLVDKAGSGSGTVTSNPSGINCGSTCSASFPNSQSVTLTATPSTGSMFAGWSGACAGSSAACTVTMSQTQSVTASFNREPTTSPVPQGVVAQAGDRAVTLTWNSVAGATSYNVYYATESGIRPGNYRDFQNGRRAGLVQSGVSIGDLTNGTTHYFVVTAVVSGVESDPSAQVNATPRAPTGSRLNDGLVAWFPLDNGSANDASGNGFNGQITGASTELNGRFGGALRFTGSGQAVNTDISLSGVQAFTVAMWVRRDGVLSDGDGVAGTVGQSSAGKQGFDLAIRNGNAVMVLSEGNIGKMSLQGPAPLSSGWHHYAWVYSSGGVSQIYVDGIEVASQENTPSNPNTHQQKFHFGRSYTTTFRHHYLVGAIDEVGVWSRPLEPAEIRSLLSGWQ